MLTLVWFIACKPTVADDVAASHASPQDDSPSRMRAGSERLGDRFGTAVTGLGDVNGDGYEDLAVSYANVDLNDGGIDLFYGSATGLSETGVPAVAGDAESGKVISALGDFDGDGLSDFALGFPILRRVEVWHGTTSGPEKFATIQDATAGGFGATLAGPGDVNNDGYADVVIGAPTNLTGAAGSAFVYYGHGSNTPPVPWPVDGNSGDKLGSVVSAAGDLNSDGFADFAMIAPGANDIVVVLGASSGVTRLPRHHLTDQPVSLAAVGDTNGDGYADLFAGTVSASGRLHRLLGGADGFTAAPDPWGVSNPFLTSHLASMGDANGDGYADAVVADKSNPSKVYFLYGRPVWANPTDSALTGTTGEELGAAITAGDFNGDGFADLVLGAPGANSNSGAIDVYKGAPNPNPAALRTLTTSTPGDRFGTTLSTADVDGDGDASALIGAPGTSEGTITVYDDPNAGPASYYGDTVHSAGDVNADGHDDAFFGTNDLLPDVDLHLGGQFGFLASAAWTPNQVDPSLLVDATVGLGDIDGDGFGDVAVAASDFGSDGAGRVEVVRGTAMGLESTSLWTYTGTAGQHVGRSLAAGDVNGDGRPELIVGAPGENKILFFESVDGSFATLPVAHTGANGTATGSALAFIGDANCDGYGDVVAGGPEGTGYFLLLMGGAGAPETMAGTGVVGGNDGLGASVAAAGDTNRDGCAEFYVGAPTTVVNSVSPGAYLQYRAVSGVIGLMRYAFSGSTTNVGWGRSIATADLDGDGMIDMLAGRPGVGNGEVVVSYTNSRDANATAAFPAHARALRADGTRIAPGLRSDVDGFDLALDLRGAFGRRPVSVEYELAPVGQTEPELHDITDPIVPPDTTSAAVVVPIRGLTRGVAYHWRARLRYAAVGAPVQSAGPWLMGGLPGDASGPHVWTDEPNACDFDFDTDGICDAVDGDIDGDLEVNETDENDYDKHACSDVDADGCDDCLSGIYDEANDCNQLPDADGDGVPDLFEGCAPAIDPDGDGLCNAQDTDSDNDGIADGIDDDRDGDGIPNDVERNIFGGRDLDGDGTTNDNDDDSDGDGISDKDEGIGDADGDGIPDWADNIDNSIDTDTGRDTTPGGNETIWYTGGGCATGGLVPSGLLTLAALAGIHRRRRPPT